MRRMFVGGLLPGVPESSIKASLAEAMARLGFAPDEHGGPVLSVQRNPSNAFAFAEFSSPAAASAAASLSNTIIAGCTVRVQRPREYEEAMGVTPAHSGGGGGSGGGGSGSGSGSGHAGGGGSGGSGHDGGHDGGVPNAIGVTGGDAPNAAAAAVQTIHAGTGYEVALPKAPVLGSGLPPSLHGVPRLTPGGPELRLGPSRVLVVLNCMGDDEAADPAAVSRICSAIVAEAERLLDAEAEIADGEADTTEAEIDAEMERLRKQAIAATVAGSDSSPALPSRSDVARRIADAKSRVRARGFGTGELLSHHAPHAGPGEVPVPPPPSPGVPGQEADSAAPTDNGGAAVVPPGAARAVNAKPLLSVMAQREADAGAIVAVQSRVGPDGAHPSDLVGVLLGGPLVRQRWPHPEVPGAGRVFLEFDSAETAVRVADGIAGRSFNGRILVTSFLGERAYAARHLWGWGYAYGDGAEGAGASARRGDDGETAGGETASGEGAGSSHDEGALPPRPGRAVSSGGSGTQSAAAPAAAAAAGSSSSSSSSSAATSAAAAAPTAAAPAAAGPGAEGAAGAASDGDDDAAMSTDDDDDDAMAGPVTVGGIELDDVL
ncbi:hypothetical protein FNF31_07178 [Cafeteria roenbergensis]|uniref:RRM domain-containing protein n=1 Tax=Cafeteria roenbergensis TaxID=33653 RepID=A0A5A8C9B4_CAFRO|nr:hypothetical protein FNF31_07178 [Cafeteria roenbergensis]